VCACVRACVHACVVHACVRVFVRSCMHAYMRACACMCTCACVHACTYVRERVRARVRQAATHTTHRPTSNTGNTTTAALSWRQRMQLLLLVRVVRVVPAPPCAAGELLRPRLGHRQGCAALDGQQLVLHPRLILCWNRMAARHTRGLVAKGCSIHDKSTPAQCTLNAWRAGQAMAGRGGGGANSCWVNAGWR